MVKFIQATCPSCGGQLQIPDDLTKAFCSYCGATVLLEWEGRPGPGPTVASYMKLGQAALQAGDYEEAYDYFSKALELDPGRVQAWIEKALALLRITRPIAFGLSVDREKKKMARGYLEKALSLDPSNVTALIFLGTLRRDAKRLEKAASLDNSKRSEIARILLGWGGCGYEVVELRGAAWRAVKFLEAAYRIDPTTKKDVAKGIFCCAFDVEYKKRFLGKPYAVLVVRRQDLIDRAVELEPALNNIVSVILDFGQVEIAGHK